MACRSSSSWLDFAFNCAECCDLISTNTSIELTMNLVRFVLFASTALCLTNTHAASDVVLIDRMEKAYTVYAGLPLKRADDARSKLEGKPIDIVTFQQFIGNLKNFVGARIVRNDYPEDKTEEGVAALIQKYPGTPFGVTWNGGIAFTRNDYQAAKNSFGAFNTPGGFSKPARESDPVAPMNHLKPLLGW